MTGAHVTLLVEAFEDLVRAAEPAQRYAALEQVLAKGDSVCIESVTANHLRMSLFGMAPQLDIPVAALERLANGAVEAQDNTYWLKMDPVTMRADMAQVFLVGHGFADLDTDEQKAIERCVKDVLSEEAIEADFSQPGRWCVALNEPLGFQFSPLDLALGMDVADALPEHTEARNWRRILNEVQVALHNCPTNVHRRQGGLQEINSVWFWGGGRMPRSAPQNRFDAVYSNQPVTRGLAVLNGRRLMSQDKATPKSMDLGDQSVLIDWLTLSSSAPRELEKLETLVSGLLDGVRKSGLTLTFFDGRGRGWRFDRSARRRFWRRTAPLAAITATPANS